ncbi:DUF6005 family protein [Agaribacterium haliotis]|uniref:DUF6005 family protein n=1 Tax=Agaribacterium haliotis TaxID=2013869 RepID=UPI0011785DAF|nr:DUF6005 family protein [Agaribacterium haliotis]
MTREQIVEAMFQVLSEKMSHANLDKFQSDARLLEDLALDSSLILQWLMFLELDHGLSITEDTLMNQDFKTVREVAQLMYEAQGLPKVEKGLEVYEDLKIHCVASCLAEIVKRQSGFDHRILYFAVWDAKVCVSDRYVLSYHDQNISHQHFFDWYETLYGMKVSPWYRHDIEKQKNLETLAELVAKRKPGQHIMVMLDMFQLPERENEFSKDPFPHYVMLGPTPDPKLWFMYDPDYRWEGVIKKQRIVNAVSQPSVAGGYVVSEQGLRPTSLAQVNAYFDACFIADSNPLTDAVRNIVEAHALGRDKNGAELALKHLASALEEVQVLSLRKYAYEHGFAYFWRALGLPESEFDDYCELIDRLVKSYKLIQFQAMKLAASEELSLLDKIRSLLDEQDKREFEIKAHLVAVKNQWAQTFVAKKNEALVGVEV